MLPGAAAVSDAERQEDAAAAAAQDWKAWYKEYPPVRRLVCTMLCRALVRGCDEAAALLMPAATVAARRMADHRWLWASLGELLKRSADASAAAGGAPGGGGRSGGGDAGKKGGKEKGVPRVLKSEVRYTIRGVEKTLSRAESMLPTISRETTV